MARHLTPQQMLDSFHPEASTTEEQKTVLHLQSCEPCRAQFEALRNDLTTIRKALEAEGSNPPPPPKSWKPIELLLSHKRPPQTTL
jgi:hypothetical protein